MSQKAKHIYISGPMTGLPELNFPAFGQAADALRQAGHVAVNPAEINTDPQSSWHDYMRADIKALCDCDALALLPGWQKSQGAHLELHIAHRLGLEIGEVSEFVEAKAEQMQPAKHAEERWAAYFDGDEIVTPHQTEAEAAGEMECQIDNDYEPGDEIEYRIAPLLSAKQVLLKRNALVIGQDLFERLNEYVNDDMHAEKDPLDMTREDKERLGQLVLEFVCQHAKTQWWLVDDRREQKCTYVAGANDAADVQVNT